MSAVEDRDLEEIRAYCRLPQMDIDIVHRKAREGDREFLAINIELIPFSQGLDRLVAMSDPFRFWGQLAGAAWWPWLQSLRAISSQPAGVRRLPSAKDE
jgi:hypothetical protein